MRLNAAPLAGVGVVVTANTCRQAGADSGGRRQLNCTATAVVQHHRRSGQRGPSSTHKITKKSKQQRLYKNHNHCRTRNDSQYAQASWSGQPAQANWRCQPAQAIDGSTNGQQNTAMHAQNSNACTKQQCTHKTAMHAQNITNQRKHKRTDTST